MKREQVIGLCVLLLLTAGIGLAGNRQLSEAAERLAAERDYQALLESTPLAEIEGETVSPDGRFEIRTTGKSGIYASGVVAPESLQVVERKSGRVLWEGEGMVWQSAAWSPEGGYLALARSARTRCSVTVMETENWTEWDFFLPDGSPVPEYTFPAYYQPWGVWQSEHTLDLAFEEGEDSSRYACCISTEKGQVIGESLEKTVETLPGRYDFNHDGQPETVEITSVGSAYTLSVVEADGGVLWKEEAHSAHVGWTSIFACSIDGQDYLIRYLPTMFQGFADYSLQVFSLDAAGGERMLHTNGVT